MLMPNAVAIRLMRLRSARQLAEVYYRAELSIRYAEASVAVAASLTEILASDPGRLRLEVWSLGGATDVVVGHNGDLVATGAGVILSGTMSFEEHWLDDIDSQTLSLFGLASAATHVFVRTWTLMQ
jgi:hypothetical protein